MGGYTTASTSLGHYFLEGTIYPIVSSLCAAEVNVTEELRKPGAYWKDRTALLLLLRVILNIFLTIILLSVFLLAALAQALLFIEKCFWILLEIATLRFLCRTSLERSTQEMMEFLHLLVHNFPIKQLQLKVNALGQGRSNKSYRTPYIEQGDFTSWFFIQFEFADPSLRNEALSILDFNSRASYLPLFYNAGERRVLVFSPLGMVERRTVVRMLKLYTDKHKEVKDLPDAITARWHDVRNNSVREFTLRVDRDARQDGEVFTGWIPGYRCYSSLQVNPGTSAVATMVKALEGLNFVADLDRVSQGNVHLSGVTISRWVLSAIIVGSSMSYYGWPRTEASQGIQYYGVMISLWFALQNWGFNVFLGDNHVPLSSIVEENKLAVIYGGCAQHGEQELLRGTVLMVHETLRWQLPIAASKGARAVFQHAHSHHQRQEGISTCNE